MSEEVVAEYGKINHKLRKLKVLDRCRLKLLQKISNELNDLKLNSDNKRYIYDISSLNNSKNSLDEDVYKRSQSNLTFNSSPNNSIKCLESDLMALFTSCMLSPDKMNEISSALGYEVLFKELSEYIPSQAGPSLNQDVRNNTGANIDFDIVSSDSYLTNLLNESEFRDLQCQYDNFSHSDASNIDFDEAKAQLSQLRCRHADILNKLIVTCEAFSPYQIRSS